MQFLKLTCQKSCIDLMKLYADNDKHSIVVEGPIGSGKTFLAKSYFNMLGFNDVVVVSSRVNDIKDTFDQFLRVNNKVLIVVENLDSGVPACSYVLLKFMEEPSDNLYVVVTCRSKENIPDTILSRSMVAAVGMPTCDDISSYATDRYKDTYKKLKRKKIWSTVRTFSDVDEVCCLSEQQISYFSEWDNLNSFNQPVNVVSWKLSHYPDNSELNSSTLVKYIMEVNKENKHVVNSCRKCLDQLNLKRIASYLTLTKLAFDIKYCE